MAKQSFDLPLLHGEKDHSRPRGVVLKAILPDDPSETSDRIDPVEEVRSLADTAGIEIVGVVTQRRRKPHASTYVGKGKVEELHEMMGRLEAQVVVVDDPLSPGQGRNIEEKTSKRVIDRVELIMDIFAIRAQTYEAKLQVELAQLRYSVSRLKRMWTHLSRFEGGIGMRGPGETQLETDRRIIRRKIDLLKAKLKGIEQQRQTQHKNRGDTFRVALVGYTNAGKSTLMKRLTSADVLVEDRLFSTLDTSTRKWDLPCRQEVILSDTVGFIRNLPHNLVASFHATLLETTEADLLLHVVDGSSNHVEADIEAVHDTLERIECADKPTILLFNKVDRLQDEQRIDFQYLLDQFPDSIAVSAVEDINVEGPGSITDRVLESIQQDEVTREYRFPVTRGDLLAQLRKIATIVEERYEEDCIAVSARMGEPEEERFDRFLRQSGF